MIIAYAAAETSDTCGGDEGNGVNSVGFSVGGEGAGDDVEGSEAGANFSGATGTEVGLSLKGKSGEESNRRVRGIDTMTSGADTERKEILPSDQSINGLKRWSQLYPRTISLGESRRVT
jgi:hypothetical protein